jgi:hypothetical protein
MLEDDTLIREAYAIHGDSRISFSPDGRHSIGGH